MTTFKPGGTRVIQDLGALDSFKMGKLYKDRTDFIQAIPYLDRAADHFLSEKKYDQFLDAKNLLLRMYVELGDSSKVEAIKEELQDLVLRNNFELSAKTFYILGLCANNKKQHGIAKEYFAKSLNLALKEDNKKDICYAVYGMATVYAALEQFDEALKEIYNIRVFFQVVDLPELEISIKLLNGYILRKLAKFQEALDLYWQAFEEIKNSKDMFFYVHLLYSIGVTYKLRGDHHMAKVYLNLAKSTVDKDNLVSFYKVIVQQLENISGIANENYDLVFNKDKKSVIEKNKGTIDFKNQFILLDLLKMFMGTPGQVYSKEEIVNNIWQQEYDPRVHDNKLYVTIKRLRKLIEPENDKPKYLYRAKNGYYFNKDVKFLFS